MNTENKNRGKGQYDRSETGQTPAGTSRGKAWRDHIPSLRHCHRHRSAVV